MIDLSEKNSNFGVTPFKNENPSIYELLKYDATSFAHKIVSEWFTLF